MGWEGGGLGREGSGRTEPVPMEVVGAQCMRARGECVSVGSRVCLRFAGTNNSLTTLHQANRERTGLGAAPVAAVGESVRAARAKITQARIEAIDAAAKPSP
jgi:hypothetical protein